MTEAILIQPKNYNGVGYLNAQPSEVFVLNKTGMKQLAKVLARDYLNPLLRNSRHERAIYRLCYQQDFFALQKMFHSAFRVHFLEVFV